MVSAVTAMVARVLTAMMAVVLTAMMAVVLAGMTTAMVAGAMMTVVALLRDGAAGTAQGDPRLESVEGARFEGSTLAHRALRMAADPGEFLLRRRPYNMKHVPSGVRRDVSSVGSRMI
jgi:hypothetical protein